MAYQAAKIAREEKIGYFRVYDAVFDENMLSCIQTIGVYSFLCRCADGDGKSFPSYDTIAAKCHIDRRTVSKALKELQEKKLLKKENRTRADGGNTSNLYTLLIPRTEKIEPINDKKEKFLKFASEFSKDEILSFLDEIGILEGGDVQIYNGVSHKSTTGHCTNLQLGQVQINNEKDFIFKGSLFKGEREEAAEPPPEPPPQEIKKPLADIEEKVSYGKYNLVQLSTTEYESLVRDFGLVKVSDYIQRVDFELASRKVSYKSHEATIRKWIHQDEIEEKKETHAKHRNRFANFKGRERNYEEMERLAQNRLLGSLENTEKPFINNTDNNKNTEGKSP